MITSLLIATLLVSQGKHTPALDDRAGGLAGTSGDVPVRVFMAADGAQYQAPTSGPTIVFMEAGETREVMVWMQNGAGIDVLLNAYQLMFPWTAEPLEGAAGTVGYDDVPGHGTMFQDQFRGDWVFADFPWTMNPSYNETPPDYCGMLYAGMPGFGSVVDPSEVFYLMQLEVVASKEAGGTFEFAFRRAPHTPPLSGLFDPHGAPYGEPVDFQPLNIVVGPYPTASEPADFAIDARQPSGVDGSNPDGWRAVELIFSSEPEATASDFEIAVSGGSAPLIDQLDINGNTVTVTFDTAIPVGECTTLRHLPTGWTTRMAHLPGDVNGDGSSGPIDILALIDSLNGLSELAPQQCDIDRSNVCQAADILRLVDLLNGAVQYDSWNGATLPACPR